jgi:hypothetical protein
MVLLLLHKEDVEIKKRLQIFRREVVVGFPSVMLSSGRWQCFLEDGETNEPYLFISLNHSYLFYLHFDAYS